MSHQEDHKTVSPRSVAQVNSTSVPNNLAAWLSQAKGEFIVGKAEYSSPKMDEVVVRNRAVAINNFDWQLQSWGNELSDIPGYPFIIGSDCAGEIVELGPNITRFRTGDRVMGMANWLYTKDARDGAFQKYCVINQAVLARLPPEIPFVDGVTLPLAVSAAAMGLYPPGRLELALPSPVGQSQKGQKMLVWGASSTTGIVAVQFALASGVSVVAVASKANFPFVLDLGATAVFDYDDPRNLEKIIMILKQLSGEFVGAYDCIGNDNTIKSCAGVVLSLAKGKVVTNAPLPNPETRMGVEVVPVNDTPSIIKDKYVTETIWQKFLPEGLETKVIKAFPQPIVIGKGLENIAKGVARLREGVSAGKVVVEI